MKFTGWALLASLTLILTACSNGFSNADVEAVKKDIKTKFESEGFAVTEVSLIRETDYRLTGYTKVEKKVLLVPLRLTKNCTVTMDQQSRQYLWECK
jgi:PBP1b-binding outer membrane lipoprotein LpoB